MTKNLRQTLVSRVKRIKIFHMLKTSLILYRKSYVPRYTKILSLFVVSLVSYRLFWFILLCMTHSQCYNKPTFRPG